VFKCLAHSKDARSCKAAVLGLLGKTLRHLSPDGVIVARHDVVGPDGSVELKFPWARRIIEYRTVDGALTGIFAGDSRSTLVASMLPPRQRECSPTTAACT
jgi:hypothetical protein